MINIMRFDAPPLCEREVLRYASCKEADEATVDIIKECIEEALDLIDNDKAIFTPQDDNLATFTKIIVKQDALIDWTKSAKEVFNQVRAFNPSPIAYTFFNGEPFKVYECEVCDGNGKAGEVIANDKQLVIACGKDAVRLKIVQKAGGKPISASDFLLGNKIEKGMIF